jgi:hypothetical protein
LFAPGRKGCDPTSRQALAVHKRDELIAIVAQREGKTVQEIARIIRVAL